MSRSVDDEDQQNDDDDDDVIDLTVLDEDDIDFLFEDDDEDNEQSQKELEPSEKLWRYIKKPLLRIGAKGATHSHGNSLRQLLEDHTAVKVKMNTKKYNGSLQEAAQALKDLAIENAAPVDIEIIQLRESEKTVLYGSPGTRQQCEDGMFPPPPLTPPEDDVDNNNENGDGTV
jgi:RNA-binding protein YhbY